MTSKKPPIPKESADPFDPSNLRLQQNFSATVGVQKVLTTVPVRKPTRQEFVRVHPDENYRLETALLILKEENETYLVDRSLWSEVPNELSPIALFTTINRQGVLSLWPVRLPAEDGRLDSWSTSALEAVEMAQKGSWIRVASNMSLGAYEIYEATGDLPEPKWPDLDFAKILEVAFKGHYIESLDHPVIRRLRGEL